jgi:hypothetical protein
VRGIDVNWKLEKLEIGYSQFSTNWMMLMLPDKKKT